MKEDLKFLDRFEQRFRGPIVNLFLEPIRKGYSNVPYILEYVMKNLMAKKQRYGLEAPYTYLLVCLVGFDDKVRDEICDLIDYYLAYESLPIEERKKIKEEKQHKGIEAWMAKQPATLAQRKYCNALGMIYERAYSDSLTKLEASKFIESHKNG